MVRPFVFGRLSDGRAVEAYDLRTSAARVRILTYGAILARLDVPDSDGVFENVVLGYAGLDGYVRQNGSYFGAVVGRYANRIAGGTFALDGTPYRLARNDGPNALHGGESGFDKRLWSVVDAREGRGGAALRLRLRSGDGDQGYPGSLEVDITYTLHGCDLRIDYEARTDTATIVNLTNHSYFNLSGAGNGDAMTHELQLRAASFTPVNETLVPTGEIRSVEGTPLDFRTPQRLGARIRDDYDQLRFARGYDFNWVLDEREPFDEWAVRVRHEDAGRSLTVFTTEPGLQVYTGNFLDGPEIGAGGRAYRPGDGFTLETQHFPDSPNHPSFPSTVLRAGETYRSTTIYRFGVV